MSMTTIANLTLCLAVMIFMRLMLVIQAPCYRQNTWYGSSLPTLTYYYSMRRSVGDDNSMSHIGPLLFRIKRNVSITAQAFFTAQYS